MNKLISFKLETLLLILFLGIFNSSFAQISLEDARQNTLAKVDQSFFIENKGQWPEEVLYKMSMGGMTAWITKTGVTYDFYQRKELKTKIESSAYPDEAVRSYQRNGQVVKLILNNAKQASLQPTAKLSAYYNFLSGNDPKQWATNVALYQEVRLANVFEKIDLKYYFDQGYLRYDYIVKAGANPDNIKFNLEGCDRSFINEEGELVFLTRFGEVKHQGLKLYQMIDDKEVIVKGKFLQSEEGISFSIAEYDKTKDLIIDPLIWSTYFGAEGFEGIKDMTLDAADNIYITGYSDNVNFPFTPGAYSTERDRFECFVSKIDASGSLLVFSTFIGGREDDQAYAIALDNNNNPCIVGRTKSRDYPATEGAFDEEYKGTYDADDEDFAYDAFVTKLNGTGTGLIFSTFIGGGIEVTNNYDTPQDVILDAQNNVYFTGYTRSSAYPTTPGAFNGTSGTLGGFEGFVTKLNASGSSLLYSAYLGGNDFDFAQAITLDNSNNAYVTGLTRSQNFPTTAGAFDETLNASGANDVFVVKINPSGSNLEYASLIGGEMWDGGRDIAVDNAGNAYITGECYSEDFPITPGVHQENLGGNNDFFVAKMNPEGSELVYASFVGGAGFDTGHSISLDSDHNVFVTGFTGSTDIAITNGAYATTMNGTGDIYVAKLNSDATTVLYGSYIGGGNFDRVEKIALTSDDMIIIAGSTESEDFPTTPGAFDETYNDDEDDEGFSDIFISKINPVNQGIDLTCPADITVSAPAGELTVQVFWEEPTATTTCDISTSLVFEAIVTQTIGMTSGSNFAIGTHAISYQASDECGNQETCSFILTVNFTAPAGALSITCPEDIEMFVPVGQTIPVLWALPEVSTTCNVSSDVLLSQTAGLDPGSDFAAGSYIISYEASDNCNNAETCSFTISITEQGGPATCPENIESFSKLGEYNGHAYFVSQENLNWKEAKAYAESKGGYLVSINTQEENDFLQEMIDEQVLIGFNDEATEGVGAWANGAAVNFDNSFNNNDAQDYAVMNYWAGTWEMVKGSVSKRFVMEIDCDEFEPEFITLTCPEDILLSTETETAIATWNPATAVTSCGISNIVSIAQTAGLPSGAEFGLGTHTISYEAIDECGNSESCVFSITVVAQDEFPCPPSLGSFEKIGEYEGHGYYLSNDKSRWEDAQIVAETFGGYLVSINSQEENDFLQANIEGELVYIGYNDAETEGMASWANGDPISLDLSYNNSSKNDYAVMNYWSGTWEMNNFWVKKRYVMEFECDDPPFRQSLETLLATPNAIELKLHPNPAGAFLQLEMKLMADEEVTIQVYAVDGRLVTSFEKNLFAGSNELSLPLTRLDNGLFILQITGNTIQETRKFVKK